MRSALVWMLMVGACTAPPRGGGRAGPGVGAKAPAPVDLTWLADVQMPPGSDRPPRAVEEEIGRAVAGLLDEDFAVYSRSARRLIAHGLPAAPYLGHAAGALGAKTHKIVCILLEPILGDAPPDALGEMLDSPYRAVRIVAARICGEKGLEQHGPRLVALLEDPDPEVRRAGIEALRRLTNRFHGYRADDPPEVRAEAVARWRSHWGTG